MTLVGVPAREAVAQARVVASAREVLGLEARRPAPEARRLQPRAVVEAWAGRAAPALAARPDLDRAATLAPPESTPA